MSPASSNFWSTLGANARSASTWEGPSRCRSCVEQSTFSACSHSPPFSHAEKAVQKLITSTLLYFFVSLDCGVPRTCIVIIVFRTKQRQCLSHCSPLSHAEMAAQKLNKWANMPEMSIRSRIASASEANAEVAKSLPNPFYQKRSAYDVGVRKIRGEYRTLELSCRL